MTNNEYAKLTQIEQLLNTLLTIIQHQQEQQKTMDTYAELAPKKKSEAVDIYLKEIAKLTS